MAAAVALPAELASALEERLARVGGSELARDAAELSRRYRSDGGTGSGPVARTPADVLAYAAARLPATYAATAAAFASVAELRPGWRPRTVLDLGAGPGPATWAAAATWPLLERATCVEVVPEMVELGRALATAAKHDAVRSATWRRGDVRAAEPLDPHDLVVLSYVLGELPDHDAEAAVVRAWAAAGGALVVVEPGTPRGYAAVIAARAAGIARGGFTTGPCPHDEACPMTGGDWCHFAVRLARSGSHRAAKGASLGYEDEKFSWVALAREATARAEARILRHPQVRRGHVRLELCTRDGLRQAVVARSEGHRYRRARKAGWGDAFAG